MATGLFETSGTVRSSSRNTADLPQHQPPPLKGRSCDFERDIHEALSGKTQAMERIIEHCARPVYRTCYRILMDQVSAEEASQETFLWMLRSLKTYPSGTPWTPWILTLATQVALNKLRKMSSKPDYLAPVQSGPNPELACLQEDDFSRLDRALVRLRPRQRALLVLGYQENLNHGQIAQAMSVSPNQIRIELFRARLTLQRALKEHE